jgi:hypothetical protein
LDVEPGCPCLSALVEGGLLNTLLEGPKMDSITAVATDTVREILHRSVPSSPSESRPPTQRQTGTVDPKSAYQSKLILYERSVLGWAILARNTSLVTYLLDLGLDPAVLVDNNGNNALHYVGKYGTWDMAARILHACPVAKVFASMSKTRSSGDSSFILDGLKVVSVTAQLDNTKFSSLFSSSVDLTNLKLEAVNGDGCTAAMEAAKRGDLKILKELIMRKACPRRALNGRYWAFLLALVRRQERVEVNMQTGLIGSDDDKYYSVAPDPYYTIWYDKG